SLFITDLAFAGSQATIDNSKIAVLSASILAAVLGSFVLTRSEAPPPDSDLGPISYDELNATSPEAMIATGSIPEATLRD
ncbi:MAG: Na+/H+ antiporter NhaA, partial [Acidimicrobiales bacterium]